MQYLDLVKTRLDAVRAELPPLIELGEAIAAPLLRGGNLFTPQLGTYWPSEFGGRAGGLMGLKPADYIATSENDVAFTTLPDPRRVNVQDDPRWKQLLDSPAQIVIDGAESDLPDLAAGF